MKYVETIESPQIRLEVATHKSPELLRVFREANDRMHPFLSEEQRSDIEMAMRVTVFPIASFIIAKVDDKIAGFISLMDNYIVGIYVSNDCLVYGLEKLLLDEVRELYGDLEVCVYLKNYRMVQFYLEEGFEEYSSKIYGTGGAQQLRLFYMMPGAVNKFQQ